MNPPAKEEQPKTWAHPESVARAVAQAQARADEMAGERHPLAIELDEARQRASEALEARDREIYRIHTQAQHKANAGKGGMTTGKIGKMFGLTPQQVRRVIASQKIRRQLHGEV